MVAGLLEEDSQGVLYDLRRDPIKLSQIRSASLSSGPFGLTTMHGIVGSPDWWAAVEIGQIKIETFVGVVRRVDGGPMGDSAIARIEGGGETKSWAIWEGFDPGLVGRMVEIRYANVPPRNPPDPGFVVDLILQIKMVD